MGLYHTQVKYENLQDKPKSQKSIGILNEECFSTLYLPRLNNKDIIRVPLPPCYCIFRDGFRCFDHSPFRSYSGVQRVRGDDPGQGGVVTVLTSGTKRESFPRILSQTLVSVSQSSVIGLRESRTTPSTLFVHSKFSRQLHRQTIVRTYGRTYIHTHWFT